MQQELQETLEKYLDHYIIENNVYCISKKHREPGGKEFLLNHLKNFMSLHPDWDKSECMGSIEVMLMEFGY